MKKYNIKKCIIGAIIMASFISCTDNFDEINQEKTGSPENFLADYKAIVGPMQSMQTNLKNDTQLFPNLSADMYSGFFSTATQFNGGKNNLTYLMMDGWNNRITSQQRDLFNISINIDLAAKENYPSINFAGTFAVKKIIKIISERGLQMPMVLLFTVSLKNQMPTVLRILIPKKMPIITLLQILLLRLTSCIKLGTPQVA